MSRCGHCFVLFTLLFTLIVPDARAETDSCLSGQPFVVGVIAPLTGALQEYGHAAQNGIELAREEHPNLLNRVCFVYEDSQWDAKTAVSAFNKLRTTGDTALIFNWGNPTTEAVAPLSEQYALPVIGMSLDPKVASGRHFLLRSTNPASDFSRVLAKYLYARGYKKLGVVMTENSYVRGLFEGLSHFYSGNIELVDTYNVQDGDFRTSVAKLKKSQYDAIGVFLISGQVSQFYRQMAEQHLVLPTFGTDFFESSTEIQLAGKAMEGAVYPHLGVNAKFEKKYVGKYNNDYQLAYAGNSYDVAMLIGRLFNGTGGRLEAQKIMNTFRNSGQQEGVGGFFSFKETVQTGPYLSFSVHLKIIKNGKIVILPVSEE